MAKIYRLPTHALRTRVTLLNATDAADGQGGIARSWQTGAQRWAHIIPATRTSNATKTNARIHVLLRCTQGLLEMPIRLQWRGQTYKCVQAHEIEGHGLQQLICEVFE